MTNTELKTYSGQTITPAWIINVHVNYDGQEHNLDLFVVKSDSHSGGAWLKYIKLVSNSIKFANWLMYRRKSPEYAEQV